MCSKRNLAKLLELIEAFIAGNVSAPDFERGYSNIWRNYRDFDNVSEVDGNTQMYVDRIFTTLDVYCSNSELRDENDLDDDKFLNEVIKLNNRWKSNNL
ncbi:hypothetical protein [Metakosakonia massiliensis]|uniref:Bacterial self-protective colicin-like immunity n=1 Tax=Phytobacter massiliensis TaxID=1485952 RepID=A0A6N3AM16_9ENTR